MSSATECCTFSLEEELILCEVKDLSVTDGSLGRAKLLVVCQPHPDDLVNCGSLQIIGAVDDGAQQVYLGLGDKHS